MSDQLTTHTMKTKAKINGSAKYGKSLLLAMMIGLISLVSFNANAESGKDIFQKTCGGCHRLTDQKMVGPGLQGINEKYEQEWLFSWIRNSADLIASGDAEAIAIFEEYGKSPMPGYPDYSDEDLTALLEYIGASGSEGVTASTDGGGGGGTDSAEEGESEGFSISSTFLGWMIVLLAIVGFWLYRFTTKTKGYLTEIGMHPNPHFVKNFVGIFVMYVALAILLILILVHFLESNAGMINTMMFTVFPYLAFGIFIVGSIYRYTKKGFQVSSLSSQFIEGKKLFWGSQPFHWGILILFFGHLTAFLFPRAILAWNGEPVRLLILEMSSFAFGLAALFGLVMLIKRRLQTKTLLVVTNKMDMVVYVVLLTQILSGLGVAFFVRWGSSWFSSVLTPYLRSIFSFNPDINAVAEMPWWIQLHIISAFLIIAIIPFTRFMHFLVAPIDYAWRKYQLVLWNWNRKEIRKSTRHTFGKKPRNH